MLEGTGYRYVVVSGADPTVPNADFIDPLIADLAALGPVPLVAVSAAADYLGTDRDAFLVPLLDDPEITSRISSVDDLELFAGAVGVVYALAELGTGKSGHYGLGASATAVLPERSMSTAR